MNLKRRTFLGGVGAGALGWSLLGQQSKAYAAGTTPKRFVVFFSPNGVVPEAWFPGGGEKDFTLSSILSPLAAHRERLTIFKGMDIGTKDIGPGCSHNKGMAQMLTASAMTPIDPANVQANACLNVIFPVGTSIDQTIGDKIGEATPFKSIELAVLPGRGGASNTNRMIFRKGVPLDPQRSPHAAFDRIFGELTGDPAAVARRMALRKSVIDFAKADFAAVEKKLGKAERNILAAHKEGILATEKRLGLVKSVTPPTLGPEVDVNSELNMQAISDMQLDLTVAALHSDLTRVASIQYEHSFSDVTFRWLGLPLITAGMGHHLLSHDVDNWYPDFQTGLNMISTWYARQFTKLLDKLAAIPEGAGTMLDNTVVLWVSEIARGSHELENMPFLMAGNVQNADGTPHFRTGRYIIGKGMGHQQLLVSLQKAYGIDSNVFGDSRATSGPLAGLV